MVVVVVVSVMSGGDRRKEGCGVDGSAGTRSGTASSYMVVCWERVKVIRERVLGG